jgi:hypothetical protein
MGVTICPSCGTPHAPYLACAVRDAPLPPDSGLSFMDRYRGTEWDNLPPAANLPVARDRKHGGPSVLLIAGVAAIAVVVAAVGGMVFLGLKPSGPMAAFLSSTPGPPVVVRLTPSPPRTSVPPAAATQPAGSSPVARPAPSLPLPPIDPRLAGTPAGAFIALMMSGDARYHAEAAGSAVYGNEHVTIGYSANVSGRDLDATWVLGQDRERAVMSVIIKDDRYYSKPAGEPWQQWESQSSLPSDSFSSISANSWGALTYAGPDERGGRRLHHLQLPEIDWAGIPDVYYLDADEGGTIIHDMGCDIWVSAAGEPVEASIWFEATARNGGLEIDLSYELDYDFSRVGEPVQIEAPTVTDDGGGHTTS